MQFYTPYDRILDTADGIEFPTWCVGGEMNIVHNLLDKWQDTEVAERDAIRYESEDGEVRTLTYAELHREVSRCASALRALGLGKGDAVGLYMPMTPEIVVAFLAVVKIGGVILPLFSGYGAQAVATRLADGNAKALFVANAMMRRGRAIPMKPTADEALAEVPSVEHVDRVRARPRPRRADDGRPRPDVGRPAGPRHGRSRRRRLRSGRAPKTSSC